MVVSRFPEGDTVSIGALTASYDIASISLATFSGEYSVSIIDCMVIATAIFDAHNVMGNAL
jgi:hypothetical protein